MQTILVLGAGRSSAVLIDYLLGKAALRQWKVVVGDLQVDQARQRVGGATCGEAILFDIANTHASQQVIAQSDVVISLLPAHLHVQVAQLCLQHRKHLITASYVSSEMRALHQQALEKDVLLLNECGLDPGIDHISAMEVIHRVQQEGGRLTSFESFTGGLIAPETDPENPWRYKFTWNPRNVVMAGQGMARYLEGGQPSFISYAQLFRRTTPIVVPGWGEFEGYANRDSLQYVELYGLQHVKTLLRGTLRYKGFCQAWNVLAQLGMCEDTYVIPAAGLTHSDFTALFLPPSTRPVEERLAAWFGLGANGPEMERLRWSGFFSTEPVGLSHGTPAQITEHILNKRWALKPEDKDMIVMWHRFGYELAGRNHTIQSSLVVKGNDAVRTAMATTVGLPLGIAARLLLEGSIRTRGVAIPVWPELYTPILAELKQHGIKFFEQRS
jgi:saccharopine dehydrogenase (NADP+, L-glutamate forming)